VDTLRSCNTQTDTLIIILRFPIGNGVIILMDVIVQRSVDCMVVVRLTVILPLHCTQSQCVCVVERELLETLPLTEQCSADEAELVRFCYENILNKAGQVGKTQDTVPVCDVMFLAPLTQSWNVLTL